jgi:hypothetical protein
MRKLILRFMVSVLQLLTTMYQKDFNDGVSCFEYRKKEYGNALNTINDLKKEIDKLP